jgi:hypothetical protein
MNRLVYPEAARLAHKRGLGSEASVYVGLRRYNWVPLLAFLGAGLALAVGTVFAVVETSIWLAACPAVMSIAFLGWAAWKIYDIRSVGIEEVLLFDGGLVYSARNRTDVVAWPEVTQVLQASADIVNGMGGVMRRERRLTLIKDGAEPVHLSERFTGIEKITRKVNEAVTPILLRRAQEQLAAGRPVTFAHPLGDLVVDGDAVAFRGTRIPLTEIGDDAVTVDDGLVTIHGQHATIEFGGGNMLVLATLLPTAASGGDTAR